MWCFLQDILADANSIKIGEANRGIVLLSNLFGCAKDLSEGLDTTKITTPDGVDLIVSTVHEKDPLSVVGNVFEVLQKLLMLKRRA